MTRPDLSELRVLLVEDDYYIATDVAQALRSAGAEVLGPCPNEGAAQGVLDLERPNAAVLDINLGRGPSFVLAETLTARRIPFVFFTGYDRECLPSAYDDVERLEKPVRLGRMLDAVARLAPRTRWREPQDSESDVAVNRSIA